MFSRESYVSYGPRRDNQGNRGSGTRTRDSRGSRDDGPQTRDNRDGHHVPDDGRQRQGPFDIIRNRANAFYQDMTEALLGLAPEIQPEEGNRIRRDVRGKQEEVTSAEAREQERDARKYRRIVKTKLGLRSYRIANRQTRGKLEKASEMALMLILNREKRRIGKYLKYREKMRDNCNEVLNILEEKERIMQRNRDNPPNSAHERYAFRREISDIDDRVYSLMQWQRDAELKLTKADELLEEIHENMHNQGFVIRQADDILRLIGVDVVAGTGGLTLAQANTELTGALDHHIVTDHLAQV